MQDKKIENPAGQEWPVLYLQKDQAHQEQVLYD